MDDEEFCLASVKVLLKKSGIDTKNNVHYCITGQEAVKKVKEHYANGGTYKLILTDFMMPVMGGIEATKLIRDFLTEEMKIPLEQQPKIIGVTAHFMEKYITDAKTQGMNEVYGKPLYFDQMKTILTDHYNN